MSGDIIPSLVVWILMKLKYGWYTLEMNEKEKSRWYGDITLHATVFQIF